MNDQDKPKEELIKELQKLQQKNNALKALYDKNIAVRNKTEEAFIASETRYRRLFEAAKDGILILDAETGMITDVNPFLIELLGYSKEQFIEKAIWEIGFFKDIVANEYKFLELQRKKYVRYENLPLETTDGRQINVEFVSNVYLANHHKVIQCNIRDITERKRTEELRESEERFRTIFEQAAIGVALLNTKTGQFIRINQKHCDFVGYTMQEMLQKTFMDITFPEDIQINIEKNKQIIEGTIKEFSYEKRYMHKDGTIVWGNLTVSPLWKTGEKPQTYFHIAIVEDITKRKQAVEALKESEEKYRLLIDNANETIIVAQDGFFKFFNFMTLALLEGYSEQDLLNNPFPKFIHQDDRNMVVENYRQRIANETVHPRYTFRMVTRDGIVKWVEINATVIEWQGKPATLNFLTDITERKRAEETKLKSEERFKNLSNQLEAILDHIPGIVFYKDKKNNFIRVNKYFAQSQRKNKVEFEGKSLTDFYTKEEAEKYYQDDLYVINSGVAKLNIEELWKTHEDDKWVNTSKIPFVDDTGEIIGIIGISIDITARKQAEVALLASKVYLDNIINSVASPIFVKDEKYKFCLINDSFCSFINLPREKLMGKSDHDFFPGEQAMVFITKDHEVFETGKENINEEFITDGQGKIKTIITRKTLYTDISGNKFLVGVISDITQLKQAEVDLLNLNEQLEIKVKLRTKELDNANLLLQNELKEKGTILNKEKELNLMKSQFLSTVSHEFRTPLSGIMSGVQLLQYYGNKWDEKKTAKTVAQILNSIQRTTTLLNDVSLIDKQERGIITIKPSIINLEKLLINIVEENKQVYGTDFEIVTTFSLMETQYFFDQEILRHIIGNVLSNAIKYSGKSRIIEFIVTESESGINFTITDFGIGIPAKDQKFLFEPFHRASNVEAMQGTGFGLTIVKRFVDLLSGKIEIESETGKGTSVIINLPYSKNQVQ